MAKIKPTHKEPISPQSQEFEKGFKKAMINHNLNIHENQEKLNEIDEMLSEVEQSLKKKIFSLPKMEALVFSDPKLSAVYNEMAENGEERFGYHYNETIMNIIFNDYVLNSSEYLQKYRNAIPKEKKRRDKSGINQLKKAGLKKMNPTGTKLKDKSSKKDVDETTSAGSAGGSQGYVGYAGPATWSKKGDIMNNSKKEDYKIRKSIGSINAISESNYLTDSSGFDKYIKLLNEETDADFILKNGGNTYGNVNNMNSKNQKIIKNDIKSGKLDNNYNIKDGIALNEDNSNFEQAKANALRISKEEGITQHVNQISDDNYSVSDWYDSENTVISFENGRELNEVNLQEKSKSKAQQKFMGMVHAYQKGELKDNEVSNSIKKAAESMTNKEVEDFASTKHKNLPEKVNEEFYDKIIKIEYFNKNGQLKNLNSEKIPQDDLNTLTNKPIKLTFTDGSDERVSYNEFMEIYSHNDDNNLNIKEDTQTMIQNNGTSMSDKAQPTGDMSNNVSTGTQETGGLSESEKLLEEINKELKAFSIHHNKLKMMSEERKTNSQILNARVGDENKKNFKKDFKNSDTKDVIDVEKELQYKDQQTDVNDPQKLGQKIEKQEIKNVNMKSNKALKNVGNSTNDNGNEIPKRNLTSDEQDEVDMLRNGQHSIVYDNEPDERFIERQKADQGKFFDIGKKQKEFKAKAPTYNKDSQPVDDGIEKSQFDKNKSGWNERKGLKESMITGRYNDILGKRRLIEFRLSEAKLLTTTNEAVKQTDLFELNFDGLGNTYLNKSVNKKVIVNESVVNAMNKHKFYTDGKSVFAIKKITSLNESEKKEEKLIVNEEINKIKHLLGYKPDSFVNTKNVKKNRGF